MLSSPRDAFKQRSEVQSHRKGGRFRHSGCGSKSQLCHVSDTVAVLLSFRFLPMK